jgi:hypothetical protein
VNHLSRKELEEQIVDNAEAVDLMKRDGSWLNDAEFAAFLKSWHDLKWFYTEQSDTVISIEVLREYVDYSRLLRRTATDDAIAREFQLLAEEALESLEYNVDEIIREGVTNLENQDK